MLTEWLFVLGKGTIIDSGTTHTYLPAPLSAAFRQAFEQVSGKYRDSSTRCWIARSSQESRSIPGIVSI